MLDELVEEIMLGVLVVVDFLMMVVGGVLMVEVALLILVLDELEEEVCTVAIDHQVERKSYHVHCKNCTPGVNGKVDLSSLVNLANISSCF